MIFLIIFLKNYDDFGLEPFFETILDTIEADMTKSNTINNYHIDFLNKIFLLDQAKEIYGLIFESVFFQKENRYNKINDWYRFIIKEIKDIIHYYQNENLVKIYRNAIVIKSYTK